MAIIKPAVAFDIDGAVVDSVWENYRTMQRTWNELYCTDYPIDFETFRSFRPKIGIVKDYFEETERRLNGSVVINPESATKTFYEMRERRKNEDSVGWINENRIYDGVHDMFSELSDMNFAISVVSSKDEKSISELLESINILKYINSGIVGISVGNGKRPIQYRFFLDKSDLIPGETVVYDDLVKNLMVADELGMNPILAPQGYEEESNKSRFINARPEEFINVVKKILKID